MKSIESCGKSVREAIEDGLKKLNKSLGEVEVKILSQGGLLRKAKVLITATGESDDDTELNIDYLGPKKQKSEEELLEREKKYIAYSENIKIPDESEMNKPVPRAEKPKRYEDNRKKGGNERGRDNRADVRSGNGGERHSKSTANENRRNNQRQNRENNRTREGEDVRRFTEESFSPMTNEVSAKAQDFLTGLLNGMGISHSLRSNVQNNQLVLDIVCESGAAIGYRGETLSALEYLTTLSVSHGADRFKVAVDCNGYREKREQSLIALAERMAQKALKTGRKVVLEPMSSPSRKVIHSILAANDKLITRSEGNEPNRRIVILPKRQKNVRPQSGNEAQGE